MRTIAGVAAALLVSVSTARSDTARFLDASSDTVHAGVAVPEPSRKVGEVRLVSRGNAVVVQTLLSTRLLARVIGEIRVKEERNWPNDSQAARAYLEALEAARERLETREVRPNWRDRRCRMLIEFVADSSDQAVLVGTYDVSDEGDFSPDRREIFQTLTPPRSYVLGNIRLILADSFKLPVAEVSRLGPLGPASPEAPTPAAHPAPVSAPHAAPVPAPSQAPASAPHAAPVPVPDGAAD